MQKDRPLTAQHFAEFEKCYGPNPNGGGKRKEAERFRKFSLSEIKERGYKLDITWLKDDSLEDSDELPEPQDLATAAITELEAAVDRNSRPYLRPSFSMRFSCQRTLSLGVHSANRPRRWSTSGLASEAGNPPVQTRTISSAAVVWS